MGFRPAQLVDSRRFSVLRFRLMETRSERPQASRRRSAAIIKIAQTGVHDAVQLSALAIKELEIR